MRNKFSKHSWAKCLVYFMRCVPQSQKGWAKRLTDPMPSIRVNNEATILFSTSFWASSLFGQSASISSINIMDGRLNKKEK